MKSELEYIESELFQLNKSISVSHRVYLGHKSHDNKRLNYIRLFNYSTKKYDNIDLLTGCNINLTNVLLLKYKNDELANLTDTRSLTFFSSSDIYNLYKFINTIDEWFGSSEYKDIYEYDKNSMLIINPKYEKLYAECISETYREYSIYIIRAKPVIYRDPNNIGVLQKGAAIYIGAEATYLTCLLEKNIKSFKFFFNTYNINMAGALILNNTLLSMQRYEYLNK